MHIHPCGPASLLRLLLGPLANGLQKFHHFCRILASIFGMGHQRDPVLQPPQAHISIYRTQLHQCIAARTQSTRKPILTTTREILCYNLKCPAKPHPHPPINRIVRIQWPGKKHAQIIGL